MSTKFNRRTIILGASATLVTPVTLAATRAHAAIPRPRIYSCSEWGARSAISAITMRRNPTGIVIHHTTNSNTSDYSLSGAYKIARAIQNHHIDSNGWTDTGQQFTIGRGGHILEGRHRTIEGLKNGTTFPQGAHASGVNHEKLGIEVDGTYSSTLPPADQDEALVTLCTYLCRRYSIHPGGIHGHRTYNDTACPGDELFGKLPSLRWQVQARLQKAD